MVPIEWSSLMIGLSLEKNCRMIGPFKFITHYFPGYLMCFPGLRLLTYHHSRTETNMNIPLFPSCSALYPRWVLLVARALEVELRKHSYNQNPPPLAFHSPS